MSVFHNNRNNCSPGLQLLRLSAESVQKVGLPATVVTTADQVCMQGMPLNAFVSCPSEIEFCPEVDRGAGPIIGDR